MDSIVVSSIVAVLMGIGAMFIRFRAAKKPASLKKIILPPIFMSTGALMYVVPEFRITPAEIAESIAVGLFFSIFLIKTSRFEVRGNEIYLQRSKAFAGILIGLLIARIAFKTYLSQTIDFGQLSGMFFLLAFSMIISWRIAMYRAYKAMQEEMKKANSFPNDEDRKLT